MPAAVKATLNGILADTMDLGTILPEWEKPGKDIQMPAALDKVSQDVVKNFPHTKRVGNYLVGKLINKGSFAKVMEGMHIPTGEKVAIKVIDKKKAKQDSYVMKNMKREPRIHQMIKHPNIVQLYETLETENCYYMVMELCLGGDLMDRICDKKKLEEREVRKYTRQILSAVDHLHRHGIVHRDLKIENFLLDENNNIKIVDFGLSNILKLDSLSLELLSTQCGSPAYAAPELLAHKKYGTKVDVWSIGVSMFAMLTGSLPFTVEPFNIKQLHQKMVNREISPIPPDLSSGAVQFMMMLLEPDPAKRPTVKEAMEEKWLAEGFMRRPLNCVLKNRLRPDELNSDVLNNMTQNMGFSISDVISILINNKPSPIMAAYCLLLKKLGRYQKGHKMTKGQTTPVIIQKQVKKEEKQLEKNFSKEAKYENNRKVPERAHINVRNNFENNNSRASSHTAFAEIVKEDEIALVLENQENGSQEVSKFADRELVHLDPPTSSCRDTTSPLPGKMTTVIIEHVTDSLKSPVQEQKTSILEDNAFQLSQKTEKSLVSSTNKGTSKPLLENRGTCHSPVHQQDPKFKDLLQAVDTNIPAPILRYAEKEGRYFTVVETPQLSPLPRLRQAMLRDSITKKISWVGTPRIQTNGSPSFLINGSKPPVFSTSRQHALLVKSLRQSKEKAKTSFNSTVVKRNLVQLKHAQMSSDLNLPVLSAPFQTKPEKKAEMLRLDFV